MNDEARPPLVIKRIKKVAGGGHHGGAWKIAYADFVTAMMAFFLLMWLIGSTAEGDRKGIAEYFQTPLRVAMAGGSGSGDSSSILKGGGESLSRTTGQVQKADAPVRRQTINLQAARGELKKQEAEKLKGLKKRIEDAIVQDKKMAQFKSQIRLEITTEGLQVTVVDEQNRPMFDQGRAALKDYTVEIMHSIGGLLNDVDNYISIAGHTDSSQYALGERGYSNWELSTDRANASRRELVAGGMKDNKVLRVVGLASSLPLDAANPTDPINRRISLVVLNEETARAIRHLPDEEQIQNEADAAKALGVEGAAGDAPPAEPAAPAESAPATPAGGTEQLALPNAASHDPV
ncbi:MAG TPA: flagellar motor protein MotB [Gammaproteobacteria bacterium]|nr:flagellar motor protein MotB [Gammaproteobacteria bacterium]